MKQSGPPEFPTGSRVAATLLRVLLAFTLAIVGVLVVVPTAPARAADGDLSLTKSSGTVLLGGTATFTLKARNNTDDPQYNLSIADVLPPGVEYVSASTSPKGYGDPTITIVTEGTPAVSHQVLVWSNIVDIAPGATVSLAYRVKVPADEYPLGEEVQNAALAAISAPDPYLVPGFAADGSLKPGTYTASGSASVRAVVSAIALAKSVAASESELLRGVGEHQTVYTLTVQNNQSVEVVSPVVVDYLPAGVEFLGCGDADISPGEYPDANTDVRSVPDCTAPDAVETVENPAGHPGGVYTRLTSRLADLAPGEKVTLPYAAGIPLRANTMRFTGGTPSTTGAQTANLDNNNGDSARETDDELVLGNSARVSGNFGSATGDEVFDTASVAVSVEDLKVVKTADTSSFAQGKVVTYTLTIGTSEYVETGDLKVTDVLPLGMCPQGATSGDEFEDCDPTAGERPANPNATFVATVDPATGVYTLTFTPVRTSLPNDDELVIHYNVLGRTHFSASSPTSALDSFTNKVTISGTTTPRPGIGSTESGEQSVTDTSQVTLTASGPEIHKLRQVNPTPATPQVACPENDLSENYPAAPPEDEVPFRAGDRVCYLLTVHFSDAADTRGASVTDFLPSYLAYSSHKILTDPTLVATTSITTNKRAITWNFQPTVAKGADFRVILVADVIGSALPDMAGTAQSNLMKFRFNNTAGESQALRDAVDAPISASAAITLDKTVTAVNGDHGNTGPVVKGGDKVTYAVALANSGASTDPYAAMSDIVVWDNLPLGIGCARISDVTDGGSCNDTVTPNRLAWTLPGPLAGGGSQVLSYDLAIPDDAGVLTDYTNHAGVVSYRTPTNVSDRPATNHPADNIDPSVTTGNVPAADDTATVRTADTALTKSNTTAITGDGNGAGDAVVGERVDYTVTLTLPTRTTVFNGTLTDALPTGLVAAPSPAATAEFSADNGGTWEALPTGVTFDGSKLTLPVRYTNSGPADQKFRLSIPAVVADVAAATHGATLSNTATFSRTPGETGAPIIKSATSGVKIVEPSPVLTKSASPATASGGQTITYTLTLSNGAGRPPLRQSSVVDCLPAGLTFVAATAPATITDTPGDGTNGCATGTTRLTWTDLGDVAGGSAVVGRYTAKLTSLPSGGSTYLNTAKSTSDSLSSGHGRTYTSADATSTVTVTGATVTKTATPTTLAPGQTGSFTITVAIPANVAFYDSAVMDVLPAGFSTGSVSSSPIACVYSDAPAGACTLPTGAGTSLTSAGQNYGWLISDLGPDSRPRRITITYTATLSAAAGSGASGDPKSNTAHYRWNQTAGTDPGTASPTWGTNGRSATATVRVIEPVLTPGKTVSSPTPAPGEVFTYTVTAANANGTYTSTAFNVAIRDVVPSWVTIDQSSLPIGSSINGVDPTTHGGGTITFPRTTSIAKNAGVSFSYRASLIASQYLADTSTASSQVQNTATITSYESLASGGRSYGPTSTTVTVTPQFPDVRNAKSAAPGPAYVGVEKTWMLTLTNAGGATANNAVITDVLPKNWLYQANSATITVAGDPRPLDDASFLTSSITAGVQTLVWTTAYAIPPNRTIEVTFAAVPQDGALLDPGAGATTRHTNTVSSVVTDGTGVSANNSGAYAGLAASADTHIDSADLKIVKTSDGRSVAGGTLTYTLTVSNTTEHGPSDQAFGGFTVTDTLPSGLGTVTASGTGWGCSVAGTSLTCTRNGTLDAGVPFPAITVTAAIPSDVAAGTSLVNTAKVAGMTYDPRPANNTSSVTDTVTRSVDIQIVKAVSSSPVVAGQNLTYTLDVRNNGISDSASGVFTVTDNLPAGLTYVASSDTGWNCSHASGTITCTITRAPKVNQTLPTITVTAKVAASVTGSIANTATVTGPEPVLDPNPGNNSSTARVTPSTSADLALSKAHSTGADDWIAGGTGTYTLTVLNRGVSDAAAPKVVDTLPATVSFVAGSVTGSHWACSASGQTVTCNRDAALAGGSPGDPTTEQFAFKVAVAASLPTGTSIHNTATVSSTTTDPNPGNNTATDDTATTQRADLGITKDGPPTAVAGDGTIAFALVVHNHGESDTPAPGAGVGPVTVIDTLPDGMTYVGSSGTNWTCSASGQTVTCSLGAGLGAGNDAPTLTIRAAVASGVAAGALTNYASVSGPLTDHRPANNTASTAVTIEVSPSLRITKTAAPTTVRAGESVTYTITVESTGPSDATSLHVSDPLAAGLTFGRVDAPSGWTCSTTAVDCTAPRLVAGRSAILTVTARVGSGVPDGTDIPNTAIVTAAGGLSRTDDATIRIVAEADLSLVKSHADPGSQVLAGDDVTFTLEVHNHGPSDAQPDVTVVDTLPTGMSYAGNTGVWECSAVGQVITCVLPGDAVLLAGRDAPGLTITATIASTLDPGITRLTNKAEVSSGTTDPVEGNNAASDVVLVGYRADLSITKTHDPAAVRVGDPVTFTLQVANAGPSVARNVVVSDTLPASLEYVSSDGGTDFRCTFTAPKLECTAEADVAVGVPDPITVTTRVTAAAFPSVANTATVDSDTADPNEDDNSATDPVTVPPKVDLAIGKSHAPEPLQVGQRGTYSLTVSNLGATDDPGTVTVTDALPAGLTYVSATGDGWRCSASGQDATCAREAGLATGDASVVTLVVEVGPAAYPGVTNLAMVSSPAEDTDPANNTAADPATVLPLYDLSLTKALKGVAGSTVSWTLAVANGGPNVAPAGASFVDSLPSELTFAGYSGAGWTCAVAAQVVTCDHPDPIAPGATVIVVLTTTIASGFSGELVNTASLSGSDEQVAATVTIPDSSGGLAYTGANLGLGVAGLLLVLLGTAALAIRRRRA